IRVMAKLICHCSAFMDSRGTSNAGQLGFFLFDFAKKWQAFYTRPANRDVIESESRNKSSKPARAAMPFLPYKTIIITWPVECRWRT
ncbi:MAG TPA: hypothetical protein VGU64_12885, partial [Terriglobales bacterium]|nr:hypothetical protein [Terriglobales bacterium]